VLAAVPRFTYTLMEGKARLALASAWGRGELLVPHMAGRMLRNAFTGEQVRVSDEGGLPLREVFAEFPVGLLSAE
jgi:maltooligosyltrehalose synthase